MAERARIGVLISGRGSNMAALLYASRQVDCPYEIALVASNDPAAPGLALARAEGVPVYAHPHQGLKRAEFDALVNAELVRHRISHVALAGYMRLLSSWFVERWEGRCLNIHPSLLPAHKGLGVHEAVIAAGERVSGCTVHLVTPALDDGPVLGQTKVAVLPGDSADSLAARVLLAEHQLYPRVLAAHVSAGNSPEVLLGKIRDLALALPEAEEKRSHGNPGFFIRGGKFFAYCTDNHHGDGITALLVKTSGADEQAMLIERDPALYFRPAYFGPAGWVGIRLSADTDWADMESRLASSWRAVAPKRLAMLPI